MLCGILTVTGALTADITDQEYNARTDARSDVITNSPWFNIPYPGIYVLLNLTDGSHFSTTVLFLFDLYLTT